MFFDEKNRPIFALQLRRELKMFSETRVCESGICR